MLKRYIQITEDQKLILIILVLLLNQQNQKPPDGETRVDITLIARDISDFEGKEAGVSAFHLYLEIHSAMITDIKLGMEL
ncbi:MAG: hypothetical protein CM15mP78_00020 [Candidatus Poseidoniales archaeon]|nr:MAG: hypothetical protein CM15mP78_00020 [Candidatus Poseidoniales archaeon]